MNPCGNHKLLQVAGGQILGQGGARDEFADGVQVPDHGNMLCPNTTQGLNS